MKKIFFTIANTHGTVYLFKEFKKLGYEIIAGDMNEDVIGRFFADRFYRLPAQKSEKYIEALLEVVRKEKIDFIIPSGELECLKIARTREEFLSLDCIPVVTNTKTLEICIDKADSYDFLRENTDIPMMKYHIVDSLSSFEEGMSKFAPDEALSIKPSMGSGSRGFAMISDRPLDANEFFLSKNSFLTLTPEHIREMLRTSKEIPRLILMEFLDGIHYDTNMICKNGEVLFQSIRTREEAKVGTITKATIVENEEIYEINRKIAKALNVEGYICTQFIGNKLIEINPRWSTSLNTDEINEYKMALDLANGEDIHVTDEAAEKYRGTRFLRYFDVMVYR